MQRRLVVLGGLGIAALPAAIGAGWLASLPAAPRSSAAPPVSAEEARDILAALQPPKRRRPLVAVVGANGGTEVTDYLMPLGILRRAEVADVVALGTAPGPMTLYPALGIEPEATIAEFDARHADGADHVIVPAMHRDDDPAVLPWIRGQAVKGAIIIGVCAGARILGAAGLLEGKRATTHWYYLPRLRERTPTMRYVADRRLVVDAGIATTTGITASMPLSLTLIEAIAGRDRAEAVARELGLAAWDARHASDAFAVTRPFAWTAIRNRLAVWTHERLGIPLAPGVDEVSLSLVADAWSRTYQSQAVTFAAAPGALRSRSGLRIIPDRTAAGWPAEQLLPGFGHLPPAWALEQALQGIAARYGQPTAEFVAMQLEYPKEPVPRRR